MSIIQEGPPGTLPAPGDDGYWDLSDIAESDRADRFEELVSATLVDVAIRIDPEWTAASFHARARRRWIEDLALVEAGCDPCSGMRGLRRAAQTEEAYLGVTVIRQGSETLTLGDIAYDLRPGDAVVWRSDQPIRFQVRAPQTKQTLIVPMSALAEVSDGSQLTGPLLLDRRSPATELFTGYLGLLSRTMDRLSASEMHAARTATLGLLVPATRRPHAPDGRNGLPIAALHDWIEQRLLLGDVTPVSIAASHGMSVRAVYRVFEDAGETLGAFIRDRRLALARRDLISGADSIADVAARWGFSDPSHFARAFRAQYGYAPRDYRAAGSESSGLQLHEEE